MGDATLHQAAQGDRLDRRPIPLDAQVIANLGQRQVDDPDYQYDTPLPPMAGSSAHDEQDNEEPGNMEGSIGELAPSGLR